MSIQSPENHNIKITDPELKDFLIFFSTKHGTDMLPYAYMGNTINYELLIKNCPDYYLSHDEIELLKKNSSALKNILNDITDIVEIGPGSDFAMENKTLTLISYTKKLEKYHPIDCSLAYLENVCNFIHKYAPAIRTIPIEADILSKKPLEIHADNLSAKKCFIFLGGTIANFNKREQLKIINKISGAMGHEDILLISVDTNKDKESILKAYNNEYFSNFIKDILVFYSKLNPSFSPLIQSFELKCKVTKKDQGLKATLIAKKDMTFNFLDNLKINLKAGQELKGVISKKPSSEEMISLLSKSFKVIDILNNSDRMKLLICQKF